MSYYFECHNTDCHFPEVHGAFIGHLRLRYLTKLIQLKVCYDKQHNDIQHNCNNQHNTYILQGHLFTVELSVVVLNGVILSNAAPIE